MIYFDNAATSLLKPKGVPNAVQRAMTSMASPGRGSHKPAMLAADTVLDCRLLLASYFNVPDPENVVFTFNATHALNIAINSIVSEGDKVVISGYEHNSVTRPLKALNADIKIAASPLFEKDAAIEAFKSALPGAKCVVCNHVSNVFGFILPIKEISELCNESNVPLIIDASQSAGVLPLDYMQLNAAFIAMPGHKGLMGPQGTGVLICNNETKPILHGGTGSSSTLNTMPEYLPDRLEAGTHNVSGLAGLEQGLKYIISKPKNAILLHEQDLCAAFANRISKIPRLKLFYNPGMKYQTGVISVYSDYMDCDTIAEKLGKEGICVRAGLHCAPTAHETVGTIEKGTVRFSFSPFNTLSEVNYSAEILKKILNSM